MLDLVLVAAAEVLSVEVCLLFALLDHAVEVLASIAQLAAKVQDLSGEFAVVVFGVRELFEDRVEVLL